MFTWPSTHDRDYKDPYTDKFKINLPNIQLNMTRIRQVVGLIIIIMQHAPVIRPTKNDKYLPGCFTLEISAKFNPLSLIILFRNPYSHHVCKIRK
jgi:hypothetical protein